MGTTIVWMFVVLTNGHAWTPYLADKQSCETLRQSVTDQVTRPSPCVQVTVKTRQ